MKKLSIFLLSFFSLTAIAQEIDTALNLDIQATIQSAIHSANQAVAQAQDQAKKCAAASSSRVIRQNMVVNDSKITAHIFNCANSDSAQATLQIGNTIISNENRTKNK